MDTKQPLSLTHRIFESIGSATDREHIVFSRLIVRGKYKFPHKIIEGRAQVLETISDDQTKTSGNGILGPECKASLINGTVWLSHHFAWITLKVPLKFGFERLNVLCGPEDFVLDGIEGCHAL